MRIYAKISDAVQNKRTNNFETSGIKEKESNNFLSFAFAGKIIFLPISFSYLSLVFPANFTPRFVISLFSLKVASFFF